MYVVHPWEGLCEKKRPLLTALREIQIPLGDAGSRTGRECTERRWRLKVWMMVDCKFQKTSWVGQDWEMEIVFISCGCYNKLPGTGWFKTTEIYFLTILEAKSLNSASVSLSWNWGVCRAALPGEALGENLFLAAFSFLWLLAGLGFWPHRSNLCLSPVRTLMIVFGG